MRFIKFHTLKISKPECYFRYFHLLLIMLLPQFFELDQTKRKFSVEIYYESNIYSGFKIKLNQDRIAISECNGTPHGCENGKVTFKKILSTQQSDSIYWTLKNLKLDTLKSYYEFENTWEFAVFDGTYGHYKFSGDQIPTVRTTTYAISTPSIDSFENLINRLIVPETYWRRNLMFH